MQLNLSSMALSANESADRHFSDDTANALASDDEKPALSLNKSSLKKAKKAVTRSHALPFIMVNRCHHGARAIEHLIFHPSEPLALSHTMRMVSDFATEFTASQPISSGLGKKQPNRLLTFGVKLIGVLGLALPISYLLSLQLATFKPVSQTLPAPIAPTATFNKIVNQKLLKIATINDSSTYFATDGFEHGFGYDVVRQYAEHLNATVETVVFDSESEAIAALNAGQIDMALTNASTQAANDDAVVNVGLSCGHDFLSAQGLNRQVAMQVRQSDGKLAEDAKGFLCQPTVMATNASLANFYSQSMLADSYGTRHFIETMQQELPTYRDVFEQSASKHGLDWQLLVAMGYQESHLQPEAQSPTGVQGIMMLTNATAEQMGVTNRVDPTQSIRGGAKYMRLMQNQFKNVPDADRIWFALAAYNMGPQAVKSIQANLTAQGRNANSWAEVYQYMAQNRDTNSRYMQCMDYVTNIRGYLEALKLNELTDKKVA